MRANRKQRRMTPVIAASIAIVAVAGCASSAGSGGSTGGGSTGGGSAAPASKQLLIGENTIMSGTDASSYAITQGFEAYLKYVDGHGGVNGYTFKWDARDNAYSPSQSATVQSQLLAANPFAISVIGTVPVTSAAQVSASTGSDIPLLVAADGALVNSLAPKLKGGIFGFVPDYSNLAMYDVKFILDTLKTKSFALAFENDSLAQGAAKAAQSYASGNGGKIVTTVPMAATTTNFTPMATQLKSSGATTVLSWANAGVTAGLQKAAAQIGYSPKWVTPFFALSSGYLQLAGAAAENTYIDAITPPSSEVSDPAVKTFVDATTAYAKQAVSGAGQQGWELAAVLVQGVRQASANGRPLTEAGFKAAVSKIDSTVGMSHLDYMSQNWGATQAAMFQVKHGNFVQVQGFSKLPGL
jgi:branched-chain amino acid transport system substrate-binding protein